MSRSDRVRPCSGPSAEASCGVSVPPGTAIALGGPGVQGLKDESAGRLLFCPEFSDLIEQVDAFRRKRLAREDG